MLKTLYFEDDSYKFWEVSTVLERVGIQADRATCLQEGLQKWEDAATAGEPYALVITDMQFPLTSGGLVCDTAGDAVISRLREQNDPVPVIVCSSAPYQVSEAYGCIWYSERQRWQDELLRLAEHVKRLK